MTVNVIGAGLAGCEAAYTLAKGGIKVNLFEMKPKKYSPAHKIPYMCELVCSNSLRAGNIENAVGLLKEEMRRLGSLIMECADKTKVPAGGALAVDREGFSKLVTEKIQSMENITVMNKEILDFDTGDYTIVATGPLTSGVLYDNIKNFFGDEYLHFYDAAAPIVSYESIDMQKAYKAARYGKGDADYINCPMSKEEYDKFYTELINAECAEVHGFEKGSVFEGCMPIEQMAKRGEQTMLFGPLKPVGLENPKDGKLPYAVVQLRQDNKDATMYNIVGFQTHLKFGEQKRVFSLIPGLENAEFLRYGVMHRNTFINSPKLLNKYYQTKKNEKIFFAGQITGVEGYVESAASGLMAGINMLCLLKGKEMVDLGSKTAIGSLANYVSNPTVDNFQPMNVNFGIMDSLEERIRKKKEKNKKIALRALDIINAFKMEDILSE
ncbi:MAG: methylenetetrahydrofolate--tRNA-(uracil(54)-C(5))-methyltransferase (FADH(2)-oxidizing) TrmFO [Ruminococcaceae bacterium]|nr:methylenetetrahydrofolate--tRNA-(uracil(54)-C(5))-methyltransferase (FADH(2)-oxidizing) TrmFO [Oscillospiraceae bacterium]